MARRRLRWPRPATLVFVEVVLAVAVTAGITRTVEGYVVAGTAGVVAIAAMVRWRGRGLLDVVRDRLKDPAHPMDEPEPDSTGATTGAAGTLLPRLHVAEVATRRNGPVGVVGDGQGFAVVLDAVVAAPRVVAFSELVRLVTEDPARPAAVQLLVEQRSASGPIADGRFAPAETYRSLPTAGIPLWNRVLVVVRHEPAWAPEAVAARGDGASGARAALVAVAARLVAAMARDGVRLRPVPAAELAALLRDVGDPGPDCETGETAWTTSTACHGVVSVTVEDEQAIAALLQATTELDVDRCVFSVSASAIDHTVCAALRVVAPDAERVGAALERLVERGLAIPLPGAQEAGVVATLPLGGGARSLAQLVNQVRA